MKVTFVHIVEQIQYEPQTAVLSSVARALGAEASRVPVDFGMRQEALQAVLQAEQPNLLAVRVTGEMREAVAWALGELRKADPSLRLLLYGPLAEDSPGELAGIADPAIVLSAEPEQGLVALLSQGVPESLTAFEPPMGCGVAENGAVRWGPEAPLGDAAQAPPPDFSLFGAPGFFGRGTGCSFFGEVGTAPIEASVGSPSQMPPNAALRIFNYPTNRAPRSRPAEAVLAFLDALPPELARIEFADREFGWMPDAAALLAGLAERAGTRHFTVRCLPNTATVEQIHAAADAGVRRVVFEYDAAHAEAHGRLAGSQNPEMLAALLDTCSSRELERGLLVSAGLPGESPEEIAHKLAFIRDHGVERVRFLPFEPRYGHPWRQQCAEQGMLPTGDGAWNRETYSPLVQPEMAPESWHLAWQDCLDLQAQMAISS